MLSEKLVRDIYESEVKRYRADSAYEERVINEKWPGDKNVYRVYETFLKVMNYQEFNTLLRCFEEGVKHDINNYFVFTPDGQDSWWISDMYCDYLGCVKHGETKKNAFSFAIWQGFKYRLTSKPNALSIDTMRQMFVEPKQIMLKAYERRSKKLAA